jgi:hypothetical protein
MRWTGQIFWLLAFGAVESLSLRVEKIKKRFWPLSTLNPHLSTVLRLLPAFTASLWETIGSWEVVSSYSSATAPGLHGISCADPRSEPTSETGRDGFFKLTKNCLQK